MIIKGSLFEYFNVSRVSNDLLKGNSILTKTYTDYVREVKKFKIQLKKKKKKREGFNSKVKDSMKEKFAFRAASEYNKTLSREYRVSVRQSSEINLNSLFFFFSINAVR